LVANALGVKAACCSGVLQLSSLISDFHCSQPARHSRFYQSMAVLKPSTVDKRRRRRVLIFSLRSFRTMTAPKSADRLDDLPPHWTTVSQPIDPGGYRIVSVRLRQAEFESFAEQARGLGLTHNLALRIAARRIAGFLEVDDETRQLLREISASIGEISFNLGQVRRAAERDGRVELDVLDEQSRAFGQQFTVLDDRLQMLLNVSKRRVDGRAMLRNAGD